VNAEHLTRAVPCSTCAGFQSAATPCYHRVCGHHSFQLTLKKLQFLYFIGTRSFQFRLANF